jgi:myo-inositol-1(or 4)-monophosphatase
VEAVSEALGLALRRDGAADVTSKGGRDLVTATDVAVEDALREFLARESGLPVVGEERGGDLPGDASSYWLIDPICGTRNFASGIPLYCINLALIEGNAVVGAYVGDPSTGDLQVGERGQGAWAFSDGGWRRLQTSSDSQTIVSEDGKAGGARRAHAAQFTAAVMRADRWDFRSLGTTLCLPYVAAGRISAYAVFWVSSLHAAAGTLLVREAGGVVSDIYGRPWTPQSDGLIAAADARLHADLVDMSREAARA